MADESLAPHFPPLLEILLTSVNVHIGISGRWRASALSKFVESQKELIGPRARSISTFGTVRVLCDSLPSLEAAL